MNINLKVAGSVAISIILLIIALTAISVNDNGYRTVVQYPSGTTFVKFDPGWYFTAWGTETVWPDNITFDFQDGMDVRYQDGGKGSVEGIARFSLPTDEESMLVLHRAFRNEIGLRNKMLNSTVQESLNLSAGLMTTEEAYAEKRSLFGDLAKDQVANGKYKTVLEVKPVTLADGTVQKTNVPVIARENGMALHYASDLSSYGIITSSFQVKEWNFAAKTLAFIDSKRDANMAIITAQAATKKAEQDKLQVIAEGQMRVAEAKYKEEEKKMTAEVQAERIKSVTLIEASRETAKAKEMTLAAVEETKKQRQLALAAVEQGKAIKILADAESHARKVLIEADNGFKLQLANDLAIAKAYAGGMAAMKMPQTLITSSSGSSGTGGQLDQLLQFQVLDSAKKAAAQSSTKKK